MAGNYETRVREGYEAMNRGEPGNPPVEARIGDLSLPLPAGG